MRWERGQYFKTGRESPVRILFLPHRWYACTPGALSGHSDLPFLSGPMFWKHLPSPIPGWQRDHSALRGLWVREEGEAGAVVRERKHKESLGCYKKETHHLDGSTGSFYAPQSLPGSASGKEPTCQCRRYKRCRLDPWVREISWRRAWQPTPVFLPGESQGQRSLVGYSP